MFTGIIKALGTIAAWAPGAETRRLTVTTAFPVEDLPLGASLAVDGVCLTVVARSPGLFAADVGPETLARTTLGTRAPGSRVHLEPPLAMGDPLGGHIVTGHVDGVGTVAAARRRGDALELEIDVPPELARFLAPKGSIAVDGVSLTVNTVDGNRFGVTLIPHTLSVTLLGERAVGARVNLEADVIAKHVARLVSPYVRAAGASS
ncbi:MAG TPA: riboflavin synthase [Polyangia bacterium]|jgi:riboflavin synthase|nr:riboflavin synthase [Polyangia bacterium]